MNTLRKTTCLVVLALFASNASGAPMTIGNLAKLAEGDRATAETLQRQYFVGFIEGWTAMMMFHQAARYYEQVVPPAIALIYKDVHDCMSAEDLSITFAKLLVAAKTSPDQSVNMWIMNETSQRCFDEQTMLAGLLTGE